MAGGPWCWGRGVTAGYMGGVGELGHLVEARGGWLGNVVSVNESGVVMNDNFSLKS